MKVELIDSMGDDLRVVNAARVSFDKNSEWEYKDNWGNSMRPEFYSGLGQTKSLSEKDQKLINYLAKHNHWTPFSHVMITMRETVPIFVARQRFKHTVGFSYNEVSRRYVDDTPEFYYPVAWRKASENKKQGSSDEVVEVDKTAVELIYKYCRDLYEGLLFSGVAPEQARMVLPQSMYTSYYVTGSLAAWARAYKLRNEEHAQREIQNLAKMWDDTIGKLEGMKHSWNALTLQS